MSALVVSITSQQEVFAKSNQVYIDSISGISMDYPDDWAVIELEEGSLRAIFVPSSQVF